jgi:single-strand DNA-binding protein
MNRITLIGFLGADADKKSTNNGDLAVLSLATKTSWKNEAGEWESRTEWHRCVAFAGMANAVANLKKGAHLLIEGELRSREYEREVTAGSQTTAISQRVWEVRIDQFIRLDRTPRGDAGDYPGPQ